MLAFENFIEGVPLGEFSSFGAIILMIGTYDGSLNSGLILLTLKFFSLQYLFMFSWAIVNLLFPVYSNVNQR